MKPLSARAVEWLMAARPVSRRRLLQSLPTSGNNQGEQTMGGLIKFLASAAGIIFIIGLLVVIGLFALIF